MRATPGKKKSLILSDIESISPYKNVMHLFEYVSPRILFHVSPLVKLFILFQWTFTAAAATVIGSCSWFLNITQSTRVSTYPAVILLGFGSSAMFVNALGFATELIGDNKVG